MIRKTPFTSYLYVRIARHFSGTEKAENHSILFSFGGLGKSFVLSSVSSGFGRRTAFCFSFAFFVDDKRSGCVFVLI